MDSPTFESFSVVKTNRLAWATVKAWSRGELDRQTLLLLGPPGTGKTHLAHAAINAVAASGFTSGIMTAEDWLHQYITSIRDGRPFEFRAGYIRAPYALALEHAQDLEILVHTLDELYFLVDRRTELRHRLLITASVRSEREIPNLCNLVVTQCAAQVVRIKQPGRAELRAFARQMHPSSSWWRCCGNYPELVCAANRSTLAQSLPNEL